MKAVLLLSMLVVLLQTEEVRLNWISQSINQFKRILLWLADDKTQCELVANISREGREAVMKQEPDKRDVRVQNCVMCMGLPLDIIILLLHLKCGLVINLEVEKMP